MHRPLFVYGTLRDTDMLAAVLGRRIAPGHVAEAVAPGFRTVIYPSRAYPALVRAPGGAAKGNALLHLTAFEIDLLDAFEGSEYVRATIPVIVDLELHEADAYLPSTAIPADAGSWSLSNWQAQHKPTALAGDARLAADLRARLIAARPN